MERTKSSTTLERKTRFLPMVAPIEGLESKAWAPKWMDVIKDAALPLGKGKPLLPGLLASGGWGRLPVTAEHGGTILRSLLVAAGADRHSVASYGTHSCKATVLSWLSNYGTDRLTRASLGYHSQGRGGTEMVYGRDNLSGPLRAMQEVVAAVALRKFNPDATRSGYFAKDVVDKRDDAQDVPSDSSEGSSDESSPEHDAEETAADELVGDWATVRVDGDPPCFFRRRVSRVLHIPESEEESKLRCRNKLRVCCELVSSVTRFLDLFPIQNPVLAWEGLVPTRK